MKSDREFAALPALVLFSAFAAGCGGVSVPSTLWPFGDEKSLERSRVPPNSTTYQCAGGKRFYMRSLDNNTAAWVILPEREFRLDRMPGDGMRFSNGKAVLTIGADESNLSDGPTLSYTACRIPSAEPPKPTPAKK